MSFNTGLQCTFAFAIGWLRIIANFTASNIKKCMAKSCRCPIHKHFHPEFSSRPHYINIKILPDKGCNQVEHHTVQKDELFVGRVLLLPSTFISFFVIDHPTKAHMCHLKDSCLFFLCRELHLQILGWNLCILDRQWVAWLIQGKTRRSSLSVEGVRGP